MLKLKKPTTHVAKREKRASFVFHLLPGVEQGFQKFVKREKKKKKEGVSVIHAENIHTRARQNAAHV